MTFKKYKDSKGKTYPHLYIDDSSGIFYSVIRKGQRVFKSSLETTDFNTARSRISDKFKELDVAKFIPKQNKLLREYFQDVLKEKQAEEIKASTLKRINSVWTKSIEPFWGHLNLSHVTQDKVTEFILWHKENRKGIQFQNVFKYLGNLFRFLDKRKLIAQAPLLTIPKTEQKHIDKKKGREITEDEIKAIFANLQGDYLLIAKIAYYTGMRLMEIGSIEISRIKRINDTYVFMLDTDDTKTGLARSIPMPKFLNEEIEKRLSNNYYLFQSKRDPKKHLPSQMIDKAWQTAKVKAKIVGRIRFHDTRHSCATRMARQNISPAIACAILGMNLSNYQKTYLNLNINDLIIISDSFFSSTGEK